MGVFEKKTPIFFVYYFDLYRKIHNLPNFKIIFSLNKLINMKKLLLVWVLVMAVISSSFAQTRQVTGKVTSS